LEPAAIIFAHFSARELSAPLAANNYRPPISRDFVRLYKEIIRPPIRNRQGGEYGHRPFGPGAIILAHFSARESSASLAAIDHCPPISRDLVRLYKGIIRPPIRNR